MTQSFQFTEVFAAVSQRDEKSFKDPPQARRHGGDNQLEVLASNDVLIWRGLFNVLHFHFHASDIHGDILDGVSGFRFHERQSKYAFIHDDDGLAAC